MTWIAAQGLNAEEPCNIKRGVGPSRATSSVLLVLLCLLSVGCLPDWPPRPVRPPIVQPSTPPVDLSIPGPVRP